MNDDAVRVNRIEFRAAMPSLRLLDAAPLAFSIQCLLPAAVGLLLLIWSDLLLFGEPDFESHWKGPIASAVPLPLQRMVEDIHVVMVRGFSAGHLPFARLVLSALLVGLTGVAVSRAAGLRFCADRRSGAIRSMRHAVRMFRSILVASFLAGLLCGVASGLFWLCLKMTAFASGAHLSQLLAGIPAWLGALGLIAATGVCGTGWLISLAAMGVDSCDGAESLSRGISYVLSRFRRATVLTIFLLLMTGCLTEVVWFLTTRAGELVMQCLESSVSDFSMDNREFMTFRHFVVELWKLSLFFSGVTVCYALLRRAEDGVHLNEVDGCQSRSRR